MRMQLSQSGKGMLLTLLMLGFSHKGTYGKVPVIFPDFHSKKEAIFVALEETNFLFSQKSNSLIVHLEGSGSDAMIVLIAHDQNVTHLVRRILNTNQTPLLFSITSLPLNIADFEPGNFQFEQGSRLWLPSLNPEESDILPLAKNAEFGGLIRDGEVHRGIILLPDWFDIKRSLRIRYLDNQRWLSF